MRYPIQRGEILDVLPEPVPGKTRERKMIKMIQMIQMIQMIGFSSFVFRIRAARIGTRVACIGARSAHHAGENTGT